MHLLFSSSEKLGIPFTHISKIKQKNQQQQKNQHISQLSFCFSSLTYVFFSVVTVLAINAALPEWNSDIIADQDSGAILANGIIFNLVTKLLFAEKFINVDFLVPFPKFEMNVTAELGTYINKLAPLWDESSWQCHVDYPTNFQKK